MHPTILGDTIVVPRDFSTIVSAIGSSSSGDTILVSPGTYTENIDFLGKAIHVMSSGGPAVTILDGNEAGSVVSFRNGEATDSILEGFTITGGVGDAIGAGGSYGGGIFCLGASSPTIRNNVIRRNVADFGGGISCYDECHPSIVDNTIEENEAVIPLVSLGGGVYCISGSSPSIEGNSIRNNCAGARGGGVYAGEGSSPTIQDNLFTGNVRSGFVGEGGSSSIVVGNRFHGETSVAVCLVASKGARIRNNLFSDNASDGHAAICCADSSDVTIESNEIIDSTGRNAAGAIAFSNSTGEIISNRIGRNRNTLGSGAGIFCVRSSPLIANNTIFDNEGVSYGTDGCGAGIYVSGFSSPIILNNTIVGNSCSGAPESGAIQCFGRSDPIIMNTIIWSNQTSVPILAKSQSFPTVIHCNVEGGWSGLGHGNIDADPMFVGPARGDFHLRFGSPCVDAGDGTHPQLPLFDFEGDVRILNGDAGPGIFVDIGADELCPEIAARFGTVNAIRRSLFDPLIVNGVPGDKERVVSISIRHPIRIDMLAPPSTVEPARFVLYIWDGEPDLDTISRQPYHLGVMAFSTPLNRDAIQEPRKILNNLGHEAVLGEADFVSSPAPTTLLDRPQGFPFPFTVTIQGFVEDNGSTADGPVSVTNAVVIKVL